jgi:hypothetical protein
MTETNHLIFIPCLNKDDLGTGKNLSKSVKLLEEPFDVQIIIAWSEQSADQVNYQQITRALELSRYNDLKSLT